MKRGITQAAQPARAACYFTMAVDSDRVGAAQRSPSSGQLGLSVVRLGMDDPSAPSAGQALPAAAPRPLASLGVLREGRGREQIDPQWERPYGGFTFAFWVV